MRTLRSRAAKTDLKDRIIRKFYPRGWCDILCCYRGWCCLYHPESYWITETGLKKRTLRIIKPQGGVFKSRSNHIPWHNIRDVDSRSDCCWAYVDIDTADSEDPNMIVRVNPSELDEIMNALRGRGAFSDGHTDHLRGAGVHKDPHPAPHPFGMPTWAS